MIIAMGIAILAMAACLVVLTFRVSKVEEKANSSKAEIKAENADERITKAIGTYNNNFSAVYSRIEKTDSDIDEIINKMIDISNKIGDMEKRQEMDHNNLKDIRMRYINYRQPTSTGSGVPWAAEYRCNEEGEDNA